MILSWPLKWLICCHYVVFSENSLSMFALYLQHKIVQFMYSKVKLVTFFINRYISQQKESIPDTDVRVIIVS